MKITEGSLIKNLKMYWPFGLTLVYWVYLFCSTQMNITYDSKVFESLGSYVHLNGWKEYFDNGPSREPVYPALIAFSMAVAQEFQLSSYQVIQKLLQLGLLFISQLMLFNILNRLKVHALITAGVVLYFGTSPAVANASLSLYSEILTMPIMLGLFLGLVQLKSCWETITFKKAFSYGVVLSCLFLLMTMVKALFEYVFFIFAIIFLVTIVYEMIKFRKYKAAQLAFILFFFVPFFSCTYLYKQMNYQYNGVFALTDRGTTTFYSQTENRLNPLSSKQVFAFIASIPGEGVCRSFFDVETCFYWDSAHDSLVSSAKGADFQRRGITDENQKNKMFVKEAIDLILKNPLKYSLFWFGEGLKMYFWESTKVGFVFYPNWLSAIYDHALFKNGLRLFIVVITVFSLGYSMFMLSKNKFLNILLGRFEQEKEIAVWCSLALIFSVVALYALVHILIRFSFPLVPLYLILIAIVLDQILAKQKVS